MIKKIFKKLAKEFILSIKKSKMARVKMRPLRELAKITARVKNKAKKRLIKNSK